MSPNSKPSLADSKQSAFVVPAVAPPSPRKLRKYQSHQSLTSSAFSSFGQPLSAVTSAGGEGKTRPREVPGTQDAQTEPTARPRTRARSNSESGPSHAPSLTTGSVKAKRPARKTDSSGYLIRKSGLDALLREGPVDGKFLEKLQELRLMVLSNQVDADSDGMVCTPSWLIDKKKGWYS